MLLASSIAGMLLAQLPVERCNSQQSGFGSLQVEFFSTACVASLTATIFFSFTMFMQLALNQHLLVPEEAKFVCMKMGIQKFDKLLSMPPPPPNPLAWGCQKIVISQILASHFAQVLIVSLSATRFYMRLEPSKYWKLNHKLRINFWN